MKEGLLPLDLLETKPDFGLAAGRLSAPGRMRSSEKRRCFRDHPVLAVHRPHSRLFETTRSQRLLRRLFSFRFGSPRIGARVCENCLEMRGLLTKAGDWRNASPWSRPHDDAVSTQTQPRDCRHRSSRRRQFQVLAVHAALTAPAHLSTMYCLSPSRWRSCDRQSWQE